MWIKETILNTEIILRIWVTQKKFSQRELIGSIIGERYNRSLTLFEAFFLYLNKRDVKSKPFDIL